MLKVIKNWNLECFPQEPLVLTLAHPEDDPETIQESVEEAEEYKKHWIQEEKERLKNSHYRRSLCAHLRALSNAFSLTPTFDTHYDWCPHNAWEESSKHHLQWKIEEPGEYKSQG